MKTNCKTSKIIASLVAMATVLCFCATGFAASYTTVTTYNLDAVGDAATVNVTSTVTGMASGEQVTYLATNGASEIVYVDQEVAQDLGSSVYGKTFSYTTTVGKIGTGTTSILFGGDKTSTIAPTLPGTDNIFASKTAAVTPGNSTVQVGSIDVSAGFKAGIAQVVNFTVTADEDYEVKSVTVNGTLQTLAASYSIDMSHATPSIVVVTDATAQDPDITASNIDEANLTDATVSNRSAIGFATLQLASSDYDSAEYGFILLKSSKGEPSLEDVKAFGSKYRAYGFGSNKKYAVKWLSGDNAFTANGDQVFGASKTGGKQFYGAVSYLIVGSNEPVYGELINFETN